MIICKSVCEYCGAKFEYERQFPCQCKRRFCNQSCVAKAQWADPTSRAKKLEGLRRACQTPERRQKRSEVAQETWNDPKIRARRVAGIKAAQNTPEYHAAQSARSKALWKDPEYRAKTIAADRCRSSNPDYLQKLSIANQKSCNDPEYRKDLSRRKTELWATPEFKEKMLGILQSPEHRASQSQAMKELWQTKGHQQAWTAGMHKRPTRPERRLSSILKDNGYDYDYVGNGGLWIGGKNPDFVWPEQKRLIEMYGSYWHDKSEIEPRTKYFDNYGFRTLIVWDYELDNKEQLLTKLKTFHKN